MNCGVFPSSYDHEILYINFNQDYSCLSVGTRRGFRIYNCEPFGKCYERDNGAAGTCEMLFSSSLVAIAGAGEPPTFSPRKLQIINTKRQTIVCELSYSTKVLSIMINRKRLVVVLETRIHIYDLGTMKILHTIETPPNPTGVCALSPNGENSLLAYPGSDKDGALQIFNTVTLQPVCAIKAHKTFISKVVFNFDGTLLATASDKGTILRVFDSLKGEKLYQFRRGSYPATIYCLSFNAQSNMLCVTSDSENVHIFKLTTTSPKQGGKIVSSLLPDRVGEAWESIRDFAHLKLPSSNTPSLCALSSTAPNVMVVTADGYFLVYSFDFEKGGECHLLRKYSLSSKDEHNTSSFSL